MCGIVGYLDKSNSGALTLGKTIIDMLTALDARGPDSAGVALFAGGQDGRMVLKISLGESGDFGAVAEQVEQKVGGLGTVHESSRVEEYLRLVVSCDQSAVDLEKLIESAGDGVEVVSMGKSLEIVKQVGSPENLDATYGVSAATGTHGIGHTRLSTESRIDLSHSQPFWAHGYPDLAIVHNGHITNYHKLKRQYEQEGVRFYTENDSEIIGIYMRRGLSDGATLREVMAASLKDFDGSFSYLVATGEEIGFVRDPFALKPLLYAETDDFVAVATEEIAIRQGLGNGFPVVEAQAKDLQLWQK
jgi:glutamate synthase domain-containing protein 1